MRAPSRRGFLLVLASAVLTLLLILALGLLQMARLARAAACARAGRDAAALAAESGLAYAAARLAQDPFPIPAGAASAANRGDDWTRRDAPGTAAPASFNPSYGHGEPWTDAPGGRAGAYDPGEPFLDADGDGRFSTWSGRTRGAPPTRFSLDVSSRGGRIPVNAGFLDNADRNGNGVPDVRDLDPPLFLLHGGLSHALANLGAILLPPGHPRLLTLASGNPLEPIRYSLLGEDIVRRRPAGGYPDAAALADALAPLGYADGDLAPLLPYLDVGAAAPETPQSGPPWTERVEDALTHAPTTAVEWATAPAPVLEALWRYIALPSLLDGQWEMGLPPQGFSYAGYYFPYEAFDIMDPRAEGLPSWQSTYAWTLFILYPDEAARLAAQADAFRAAHDPRTTGWEPLYRHILDASASISPVYPAEAPGDGRIFRSALLGYPVAHVRHAQIKADLAFAALFPDPHPAPFDPPMTWSGWGITRWTGFPGDGGAPQAAPFVNQAPWAQIRRVALPTPLAPGASYDFSPFITPGDKIAPLPLTLRPPCRFQVASTGIAGSEKRVASRARATGDLLTLESLRFTSQEDFENMSTQPDLARAGVQAVNDPVWGEEAPDPADTRRRELREDGGRIYRHLASLPLWDHASFPTDDPEIPAPDPAAYYPRFFGALTLAKRQPGPQGADLYWPFGERDVDSPDAFLPEGADSALLDIPTDLPSVYGWPMAIWPPSATVDQHATPFQASGEEILVESGDLPFTGLPGMPAGAPATGATIEGWCAAGSYNGSWETGWVVMGASHTLTLTVRRNVLPDGRPGQTVSVAMAPDMATLDAESSDGETTGLFHHVALTVEPDGNGSRFRLYLDGQFQDTHVTEEPFQAGADNPLLLYNVGDVRFHAKVLSDTEIAEAHARGCFVTRGTYISPLYVLDAPARLAWARWTGLIPPAYRNASDAPVDPFRVTLVGYADAAGNASLWTEALPASGVLADLRARSPARAFRYTVTLDASDVVAPLVDTPVFEAIDFLLARPGRAPLWTAYGRQLQ